MMKDDHFKLLRGFADKLTDRRTDICDCRVAFATEKHKKCCIQNQTIKTFDRPKEHSYDTY